MPKPMPVLVHMSGGITPALRALTLTRPARAARLRPAAIPEAGVDAKFKCVSTARGRPEMPV